MSEWKEGTLKEIAEIEMGQSPSGDTCNSNGQGIPLLNGPTEFGARNPIAVQYTIDAKRLSRPNDILFCVRGSTTGKMNWSDKKYAIGRGLAAIRHKKGDNYRYFIRGIIDHNLELLLASATGSTFPNISRNQLEELEILIPPLPEQTAIASVLSSLDDKIDLLHRQNATLEKMAETLFRQWFVEEAKEEWENCNLEDLCTQINSGGTPLTKIESYYNGNINWYSTKELNDNYLFESISKITQDGLDNSSAKLFPKGTVLIAIYAAPTVGRLGILGNQASFNQAACGLVANNKICCKEFIYLFLKSQRDELNAMASGSAQQNLNVGKIKSYPSFIPDEMSMAKFKKKVVPLFDKIEKNAGQIRTLTSLRDTLLPKLMSGDVRVEIEKA
ncbi:MAG: restriction endonuclease subunit S [Brumimicrobium sp.]|nr:restriction endonuclease subunit S [Brumimicrobium sp.]